MDINNLIQSGADITVSVTANDLEQFAKILVQRTKEEITQDIEKSKQEVYYTTAQVAELLNIDKATLWRWKQRGYVSCVRVGGRLRYLKSDIQKIIEKQDNKGA